ncbi:hypothetical protein BDY24DRAFT_273453 [Mrakia frigida]|uniref:uncharacterized protein n=1 Tax=Mrakia frigida TaxID=29902 RepID=UPI003FCC0BDE
MEWETWVFTRFDWNASGESSARNSISHGHAPGTNASRTRTLDGTAEEYPDNVAPKLSAAPLGTRRPTTKSITSSTASLSLSRTISNLEMTSTTSLTSLSSSTTKAKQSFPSVIAEAFSGIVLATATLGRSRSSSSANGKGHRRSLTASSSHEVFSTTDRKNILEPRSPLPIKTGVDSSGEQVFLIGGDGTETDPGPIEETAAQWSRRMGSKDQEGEGAATIKSRASSQAERRKTTPPGTHHSSTTLGEVSAAEETNHRRRQTVTASHFQSPTPFSRSSFASVKTVSSVASTSTTSLDTPRDFNPQPRPSSSSSSSASQGLPKKTPSPTPSVKSKNSSSPPQPPPPRSSSIPIPSIPQHRRHDSSTLQSILSTSPRSFTSHNVHSSPSARSLASSASTSSTPNRKTLLPLLPPSAYTPPSILSPSLVPPLIPKRVDSYPISDSPRGDVSFGAAILTGGPSRMSSVEDLGFIESSRSSASSSASAARRGRRQSEGSSSNSSSNGRRKFVAAAEEEKASLEGSGEGGRVEGEGFALMGSSKGRLMKERSLSRKKSLGEGGGGIRRKAVDYGPLMGEL